MVILEHRRRRPHDRLRQRLERRGELNHRFQAQQKARSALDKLRLDIHCASAAQAQTINTYPSVKLAVGNCYSTTPTISWCVVQALASPPRYQLYRTTSTTNICQSADASRVMIADYLTSSSVFTTATIPQYSLQTVGVSLKVSANPRSKTAEVYKLTDSIVARNIDPLRDRRRLRRPDACHEQAPAQRRRASPS